MSRGKTVENEGIKKTCNQLLCLCVDSICVNVWRSEVHVGVVFSVALPLFFESDFRLSG